MTAPPQSHCTQIYWSGFKASNVVALLQCSVLSARCGTMDTSHTRSERHISGVAEAISQTSQLAKLMN